MRLHLFFIFFTGNSLCSRRRGYWLEFIGLVFRAELSEPDVWNQSKQPEGVQKWRMFRSVSWWIVWAAVLGPVTSLPIRRWTTAPWAGWTPFVWEVPPLVAVTVRFSAICKKTPSINTKTNRKYIFLNISEVGQQFLQWGQKVPRPRGNVFVTIVEIYFCILRVNI